MRFRNYGTGYGGFAILVLILAAGCLDDTVVAEEALQESQAELIAGAESCSADELGVRGDGPLLPVSEDHKEPGLDTFEMYVDWDDASLYEALDPKALPEGMEKVVHASSVPVLMPGLPELVEAAFITHGEYWYAVSMQQGDHSVLIQASRMAFADDEEHAPKIEKPVEGQALEVSRNSLIATVVFPAFGLIYTIDVECENPDSNPHCTEDDYILDVAKSLVLAGGAR